MRAGAALQENPACGLGIADMRFAHGCHAIGKHVLFASFTGTGWRKQAHS
jgi:hypothetical protein